jgi:hypothetical protein
MRIKGRRIVHRLAAAPAGYCSCTIRALMPAVYSGRCERVEPN